MSYVRLNSLDKIKKKIGIDYNGKVQKFFTNTCAKHMDPFVPFDTGTLAETVVINGQPIGPGVGTNTITYQQPYAEYVYYGISKSGKELNYHTDKHPEAGPYWDRRMVSAKMNDIVKEVQEFIDRGEK